MLNTAIEQLDLLIKRLEMMFQVQTHEVVQDLKKIKEELNNNGNIPKTKKEIEEVKVEITEEQNESEHKEEVKPIKEEKDIVELRNEYKKKFNKNPFA
jgi:hypothetical protein